MAKLHINREGGDTIFYTVTGGVATEIFRCTDDGTLTPIKEIAGAGAVPVGGVIAWIPGYFGTTPNQAYATVLAATDTVADANAYLSPKGWRVCDGTALNDAASPIWNGANRYLPHLADNRFMQGSLTVGGTSAAGSNVLNDHTHSTFSLTAAGQTLGSTSCTSGCRSAAHNHALCFGFGSGSAGNGLMYPVQPVADQLFLFPRTQWELRARITVTPRISLTPTARPVFLVRLVLGQR